MLLRPHAENALYAVNNATLASKNKVVPFSNRFTIYYTQIVLFVTRKGS